MLELNDKLKGLFFFFFYHNSKSYNYLVLTSNPIKREVGIRMRIFFPYYPTLKQSNAINVWANKGKQEITKLIQFHHKELISICKPLSPTFTSAAQSLSRVAKGWKISNSFPEIFRKLSMGILAWNLT